MKNDYSTNTAIRTAVTISSEIAIDTDYLTPKSELRLEFNDRPVINQPPKN